MQVFERSIVGHNQIRLLPGCVQLLIGGVVRVELKRFLGNGWTEYEFADNPANGEGLHEG